MRSSLMNLATIMLAALTTAACQPPPASPKAQIPAYSLITAEANPQTHALYSNLAELGRTSLLFGHQNSTAYGVLWYGEPGRSDIKDITGSYPAVMGWDLGDLELGVKLNLDWLEFDFIIEQIKETFQRGGISTLSWHMRHPATGTGAWETKPGIKELLPGGRHHKKLRANLDAFAEFNAKLSVSSADGSATLIPVIFRPWHEHNGDWFWWGIGKNLNTEQDFVTLWRFTVDYLRNVKKLPNLIFAYSPDRSRLDHDAMAESYLLGYPGDDYVDILGIDNYWDFGGVHNKTPRDAQHKQLVASLEMLADLAETKGKVAAVTEGGQDTVVEETFWTERVLSAFSASGKTRSIAYFLVWRNANKEREQHDHFYAPYKGHASEGDFMRFFQSPFTLFENDLPDLYSRQDASPHQPLAPDLKASKP